MSGLSAPIAAEPGGPTRPRKRADGIKQNAAYAFAAQMATAAFTALLTLFLVRRLGPESYGLFALALSVGGLAILPADLGVSGSAARLIARERDSERTLADVFADAIRLKAASTGLASLVLFLLAGWIAGIYGNAGLLWPVRVVALSLFAESTLGLITGVFVALGKVSVNFYITLTESALEAGFSIVIVLLGGGAVGALVGRASAYAVGCALALLLVTRHVGSWTRQLRQRSAGHVRAIAGYATALALVEGSWVIFSRIDGLLIGGFLNVAQVGFFQAPMRLSALLSYPGYALALGVAPTLARPQSTRPDAFMRALRYIAIVQVTLLVPCIVWAEPIVRLLLGSQFARSATVLQAIAPFVFLLGFAPLVSIAVDYLGDARKRIPIALATVAINVILDIILIPRVGIVGAAIGTDVAFAVYVPAHLWLCARRVELDLRPLAATLARLSVAALAAAAVLAAFGVESLSTADWLGGGALGAAVFAGTLLLTREVSIREIRSATNALRSLARRR
jgi:O-antigen/teichoic acid export membrane protein